jgi:hypothetical protein
MRLKYLKGEKGISLKLAGDFITVNFGDPRRTPEYTAKFTPEADLPDEYGQRLLDNEHYKGLFARVDVPKEVSPPQEQKTGFPCDKCDFVAGSKAGLGSHKRTHKEK